MLIFSIWYPHDSLEKTFSHPHDNLEYRKDACSSLKRCKASVYIIQHYHNNILKRYFQHKFEIFYIFLIFSHNLQIFCNIKYENLLPSFPRVRMIIVAIWHIIYQLILNTLPVLLRYSIECTDNGIYSP